MTRDADVLIVGAGLNGPLLALALARAGLSSLVLDSLPVETRARGDFDGRAYALALASGRMLRALGLWEALAEEAQPILKVVAADGRPGEAPSPFLLELDHAEIEEGPLGHMVEDRHLRRLLLQAMAEAGGVTHLPGATVVAQAAGPFGVRLDLADGRRLTGRLLVGCDGRASGTARRAGIRRLAWNYDQTALVCALRHELPHEGVARQLFLPAGPLAVLPLRGDRSSIVWTETAATAEALAGLDDAGYLAALRLRLGPGLGDVLGEVALAGARWCYPLGLSLAQSFVAERLALVGDAAHGLHPIAGQGLNLGLRDVAALAEVLTEAARRGEDIAAAGVLERYQRWRRFDTVTMAVATDGFNRLFSSDNALLRMARDLGMGAAGSVPGLRRFFMREAAGLNGTVPRLLQGRPV